MSNTLRTGFTTGTCAAAGAKAGVLAIKEQKNIDAVDVLLPRGTFAKIQIIKCEFQSSSAICTVIKDGGDDPDVTHGAEIVTKISLEGEPEQIRIQGGKGVGKVTKPGLGLEIGKHAINPVPKKMIEQSVREIGKEMLHDTGILVTVSVPNGEKIALKTDNPRLGIIGGISILGTSGIVTPFSTASYAAAIRQNIQVASAMKDDTVVLTTGGRSEEYAMKTIKLADHCFVQIGLSVFNMAIFSPFGTDTVTKIPVSCSISLPISRTLCSIIFFGTGFIACLPISRPNPGFVTLPTPFPP